LRFPAINPLPNFATSSFDIHHWTFSLCLCCHLLGKYRISNIKCPITKDREVSQASVPILSPYCNPLQDWIFIIRYSAFAWRDIRPEKYRISNPPQAEMLNHEGKSNLPVI
jgi:hypothetical protein